VQCRTTPTHRSIVHAGQVVEDERGRVDHLDRAGRVDRVAPRTAEPLGRQKGQEGPHALARREQQVPHGHGEALARRIAISSAVEWNELVEASVDRLPKLIYAGRDVAGPEPMFNPAPRIAGQTHATLLTAVPSDATVRCQPSLPQFEGSRLRPCPRGLPGFGH